MAACAATRPRSSAALCDAHHWSDQRRNRVEHDASRCEGLPPFTARELDRPGLPSADVKVKLQQQLSGCWRTLAGAEAFLALRSYVSTARKQGMNPLAVLRQLVESRPCYQPPVGS
jgi:hypothetical protein